MMAKRCSSTRIWRICCPILILWCLFSVVSALEGEELLAATNIRDSFPGLQQVNPLDRYLLSGDDEIDWGGSWTKPAEEICSGPDGWDVHGVFCENGHIKQIRLCVVHYVYFCRMPSVKSGEAY